MLNHLQKYENYFLIEQNDYHMLFNAHLKSDETHKIILTQIDKKKLLLPVDVCALIGSLHRLEMLEEDKSYWYIIQSKVTGVPVFGASPLSLNDRPKLTTQNLLQFFIIISDYNALSPYYQNLLLEESQFLLNDGNLVAQELFLISSLASSEIDFACVKSKVHRLIEKLLSQVNDGEAYFYERVDWTPIFSQSELSTSLKTLAQVWIDELETFISRSSIATPLTELYAIPPQESSNPISQRRVFEAERLESMKLLDEDLRKEKRKKPAFLLLVVVSLILIAVLYIPKMLTLFNLDQKDNSQISASNTKGGTTGSTASEGNAGSASSVQAPAAQSKGIETLDLSNIDFELGTWSLDKSLFYTGNFSLKLIIDDKNPAGILILNNLKSGKSSELSLWIASSTSGTLNLKVDFLKSNAVINTIETKIVNDAANTWTLIHPLGDSQKLNVENADAVQITIEGAPQTIWVDDIALEMYK